MKSIGNTPLLSLKEGGNILAKAEYENPTGSAKDRTAWYMVLQAEKTEALRPGGTIIEPTSGNTGISLAAIAKSRGYRAIIVMPDFMSVERQQRIKEYGAEIVLTPGAQGMAGSIEKAEQLAAQIPGSFIPNQFENKTNALAHYETTGPEVWQQTNGGVDIFVACVGTGGTLTGTGRFLKEKKPHVRIVAVEPAKSPVLSEGKAGSHGIQGIGAGFVPKVLNTEIYDEICIITDEEALNTAKALAEKEGIMCGISSGTNVAAALRLAKKLGKGKTVVTILPDTAERYFSTPLFD